MYHDLVKPWKMCCSFINKVLVFKKYFLYFPKGVPTCLCLFPKEII